MTNNSERDKVKAAETIMNHPFQHVQKVLGVTVDQAKSIVSTAAGIVAKHRRDQMREVLERAGITYN